MHGVFDTESLQRQAAGDARTKRAADTKKWIAEQQGNMVLLDDNDLSPANAARQLGHMFYANEFETRLSKLNRNLLWETSPFNPTKKRLYHVRPGAKEFICLYENGVMPEHSIMSVVEEDILDIGLFDNPNRKLDRKDLPAHTHGGVTPDNPLGEIRWKDPNAPLPGTKRVRRAGREKTRGWRTVLIMLVWYGIATPTEVEKIFGSDNRPEWAVKLGKRAVATQL